MAGGVESPSPFVSYLSDLEMDTAQASLRGGATLPVLAVVRRYSVCTGCSWQEEPQCLRGGPGPGRGQAASSDCLGKEEGRKGCSPEENVAMNVFLLDFLFARRGDA